MPIGFDKGKAAKPSSTTNDRNRNDEPAKRIKNTGRPDDSVKATNKQVKPTVDAPNLEEEDTYDDFDVEKKSKIDTKYIVIIGTVVGVIVLALLYNFITKDDGPDVQDDATIEQLEQPTEDTDKFVYDENGNPIYNAETNDVVAEGAINPGDSNYVESTQNQATAKVYKADDVLKDINGVDISAIYNVVSRDYVYDYVSYVAKRGIIDDGMEIYWLEADYKGKKYRIQVPYFYFKDFDETGVCRVQIEVLNIEGGGKVISYMQVVDNDRVSTED